MWLKSYGVNIEMKSVKSLLYCATVKQRFNIFYSFTTRCWVLREIQTCDHSNDSKAIFGCSRVLTFDLCMKSSSVTIAMKVVDQFFCYDDVKIFLAPTNLL